MSSPLEAGKPPADAGIGRSATSRGAVTQLESTLFEARVLPIVRTGEPDSAVRLVAALTGAGATVIEITTTIPRWDEVLRDIAAAYPGVVFGVGTVTEREQARVAVAAGAAFLVSPWLVPEVRAVAGGTPLIEGALTPSELAAAARGGVAKLFPAGAVGPSYLRSVRAVLPDLRAVPTGGIAMEDVASWIEAGAIAVGLGSELTRADDPAATFASVRRSALPA